MGAARHRHWFTALWSHLGPYGEQNVHVHPCIQGEPGECDRVIIGPGRDCDGDRATHYRRTLTGDGPRARERRKEPVR